MKTYQSVIHVSVGGVQGAGRGRCKCEISQVWGGGGGLGFGLVRNHI
jgi:hypothetical protein